jgi:hypothetical protein
MKIRELTRIMLVTTVIAMAMAMASGCATPHDSDIPWNSPASWEGSPYIPGFSQ